MIRRAEAERIRVIENVYGSVVAIYGNNRQGGGSGVLYDADGLALTNHHVVAAAGREGWAGLADGKLYRWRLIGTDPGGDVAIIQLQGRDSFPVSRLGNSDYVRVGDFAMAMGNPFVLAEDQKPTVTLGIVSGIKRYQPGAGVNTLVYGNCIQIDSSINPGNSGGPLFNMQGEVIGINGRGSFKERGRVNVGLGYAISSNQVKNFLPDLLATKVAQHGTLDAVFGNRGGQVICETINLDSPIAQLGLQLGDRLVSFDDLPIDDANQFTNIISTLPADWPAKVTFEREDEGQKTVFVRMLALPYQTHRPKEPEKKPEDDKDKSPAPRGPKVSISNAGEISDAKLNLENAQRILRRCQQFQRVDSDAKTCVFELNGRITRDEAVVGEQLIRLASDGRFRVTTTLDEKQTTFAFDGSAFYSLDESGKPTSIPTLKALLDPQVYQVASIATVLQKRPLEAFGKIQLDGSDKAQSQISYRLRTTDDEGDWFHIWLSVLDAEGQPQVRLLKSGPDADANRSPGAITYHDWQEVDGVRLPFRRELVRELAEQTELIFTTEKCVTTDLDQGEFEFDKGETNDAE